VLGGTQSLHTNSYDEALSLPTEDSVRVALRTQQILGHESGAADTIDPLAGSYYVESLTEDIEAEALEILDQIDDHGGAKDAVEEQWIQRQIQDVAYDRQQEIEDGDRVIVGVNEFQIEEEEVDVDIQEVSEDDERRQIENLDEVKEWRDDEEVEATLEAVRDAAQGDANLMPPIVDAVKAYATIGEISNVLRDVYGEYHPGSAM
jgi:methylmalonyl-CoA mutase N-terminal domain/subunit